MNQVQCRQCRKQFNTINEVKSLSDIRQAISSGEPSGHICYSCALKSFSNGCFPEEGDFNSALIVSGEMSEEDYRSLMEELRAVETGRSIREPYVDENESYIDICNVCGHSYCMCDYPDDDEDQDSDSDDNSSDAGVEEVN